MIQQVNNVLNNSEGVVLWTCPCEDELPTTQKMGSNSSRISDLPKNEYLKKLSGTESVSENDPFWNQLFSFSFPAPTSSSELKLLEEATISVCKSLEPESSGFRQSVRISQTTRGTDAAAAAQTQHINIAVLRHRDITYEISVEAISAMVVFLSCQLFHKEVLRQSISHKYLMQGPWIDHMSSKLPFRPNLQAPLPNTIINFNSLYTALCEQQTSDQATLLLYTLLHQNSNVRTYMLARTDMENLVLPILEILYHVEERNSHHVYMALIILLILTEDDGFNRSIHEVDKYLHTNCLAALANMSAQFRSLHQYAAQRII
ncbi:hypothetical protein A6R68_01309, partial [Neotoma lepida]